MKRVNILVGRFQPFTAGHYKCVEAAWNLKNIPTVVCIINVSPEKVDKRHPFPSDMLVDLYGDLFSNDIKIAGVIPVRNADIVTNAQILADNGFKIASWTCGTDRYDSYSRMAERYADKAGLSEDFEMIEVPRSEEDISATKARNCLLNDDKAGFLAMIPPGSNEDELYFTLKEQIDNVYNVANESLEKRIAKLEKFIFNEAKQIGTLYHICTIDAYLKYILPTDTLKASGNYYNHLYGGNHYISFTRDKYFVVSTETINGASGVIQLVIDGDKLSENYKIKPYNDLYYGDTEATEQGPEFRESEECVLGPIKHFSKYIKNAYFDISVCNQKTLDSLIKLNSSCDIDLKYKKLTPAFNKEFKKFKAESLLPGDDLQTVISKLQNYMEYSKSLNDLLFSKDYDKVAKALSAGISPLNRNSEGTNALVYYCINPGYNDILNLLISNLPKEGDIETYGVYKGEPLTITAVKARNYDALRSILIAGMRPDFRDSKQKSALVWAVELGLVDFVDLLIQHGADANQRWKYKPLITYSKNSKITDILKSAS